MKIDTATLEKKSKPIHVLLYPSVHDDLKTIAKNEDTTVNNVINEGLKAYAAAYKAKMKRAKKKESEAKE